MKRTKSSSIKYIPPEVLTQILVNLPAKSLLRFRCVSKSWCSIINDPDLVNMHLQFCNNNKINSDKLLSLEGLGLDGQKGCLLTLLETDSLLKTGLIFKWSESHFLHGSCNSLLLISRCQNVACKGMRLSNPSIRKSLLLPLCPLSQCFVRDTIHVLGFVPRIKDFKVIAISLKDFGVAVYTLGDKKWAVRKQAVRDNGVNFDFLSNAQLFGPYYFSEGAAHWLGNDPCEDSTSSNEDGKPTHLISLDFDTESFTFLKVPHALDEVHTTIRSLFLLGESLAFFCISPDNLKIWVLKQESGNTGWTLWFAGPSSNDGFGMFYHSGPRKRVLYYKGDGGCLIYGNKSYNIATCQVQSIAKSLSHYVELETYSESLVLGKGYGAEDTTSSPFCLPYNKQP